MVLVKEVQSNLDRGPRVCQFVSVLFRYPGVDVGWRSWSTLLGGWLLKSSAGLKCSDIDETKSKAWDVWSPGIIIHKQPVMLTVPLRNVIISAYCRNQDRD